MAIERSNIVICFEKLLKIKVTDSIVYRRLRVQIDTIPPTYLPKSKAIKTCDIIKHGS